MAKEVNLSEYGIGKIRGRGRLQLEKPGLIISSGQDSYEFCPVLKTETNDTYCHGQVLGYKAGADGKPKVWAQVGTAGTATEKRACGVLVATDQLPGYAHLAASPLKDEPIPPWAVLVRNAVVMGSMLRDKGGDEPDPDEEFDYYAKDTNFNDYATRVAELENYCNIKVSEPMVMVSDILATPGNVT